MGPTGIVWHASNRQETLAAILAERMQSGPRPDPLLGETVLVPNRGLGRWLTQELAQRLGVVFNVRLPFPGTFFGQLAEAALGRPAPQEARFFWEVHAALGQPVAWGGADMLSTEMAPLVRVQTAWRLSQTLDAYSLYRPDWTERWERGEAPHWQARLWGYLVGDGGAWTLGSALRALLRTSASDLPEGTLPCRLWVYGVPSFPALMLDVLAWLGQRLPVELLVLEPTSDFIGDLPGRRNADDQVSAGSASLLPALGRLNRDRTNLLLDRNATMGVEAFEPPTADTLLGALQASLYETPLDAGLIQRNAIEDDGTVQVHASHSAYREVEALRDCLLECFEQLDGLDARDVLILTPDLATYVPLLEAVFRRGEPDQWIALSTAHAPQDQPEGRWSRALDRLLEMAESRLEARTVFALLEEEAVLEAQGWTLQTLERFRLWMQRANIAWGRDGEDRARLGLAAYEANSWRFGIERLLLGVAMDADEGLGFAGRLPVEGMGRQEALLLGRWLEWLEQLFDWREQARRRQSGEAWAAWLQAGLEAFLGGWSSAGSQEARTWQGALDRLRTAADTSPEMDLASLRYLLRQWVGPLQGPGLFRGGVNVATPSQAQGVPARVVVCLGFDAGTFPRSDPPDGSDLREGRREGEPTLRDIDRQAFLETVLGARERLILSYTGLAPNPDAEAPPSPVIQEVLSVLPLSEGARAGFVRRHPMVAHAVAYFAGDRLFTYDGVAARLASSTETPTAATPRLGILDDPAAAESTLTVESLVRFWRDPADFFLRERLGIRLPGPHELLGESEAPAGDSLEDYRLRGLLLEAMGDGNSTESALARLQASGDLAPGNFGHLQGQRLAGEASGVHARLRALQGTDAPATLPIEIEQPLTLTGQVYPVFGDVLVRGRPGKVRPADQLETWLWLAAAVASGHTLRGATVAGTDGQISLRAPETPVARAVLEAALEGYREGRTQALAFSPGSALVYATRIQKGDTPDAVWRQVEKHWRGTSYNAAFANINRPANRICFGQALPQQEALVRWAKAMAGPLIEHLDPELHG